MMDRPASCGKHIINYNFEKFLKIKNIVLNTALKTIIPESHRTPLHYGFVE